LNAVDADDKRVARDYRSHLVARFHRVECKSSNKSSKMAMAVRHKLAAVPLSDAMTAAF